MDEIEKLLRKVDKKDRAALYAALDALRNGNVAGLKIKKLTNSRFYRVRVGDFRIVFLMGGNKNTVIIESVRLRNERTYRT